MTDPTLDAFAAGEIDTRDLAVLDRIAVLYEALDPVPGGLVDRVTFGITLDALHAEIAELQRSTDLAGVRSDGALDVQTVTFTSRSLTTMVTISPDGPERVRIDGWIAPGAGAQVDLRLEDETRSTVADEDGRFVFEDVPRGMAQFVVRAADGSAHPPVVTPSIEL